MIPSGHLSANQGPTADLPLRTLGKSVSLLHSFHHNGSGLAVLMAATQGYRKSVQVFLLRQAPGCIKPVIWEMFFPWRRRCFLPQKSNPPLQLGWSRIPQLPFQYLGLDALQWRYQRLNPRPTRSKHALPTNDGTLLVFNSRGHTGINVYLRRR